MIWRFKDRSTTPGDWAWKLTPSTWRFKAVPTPGDWAWLASANFPTILVISSGYCVYRSADPDLRGEMVAQLPAGTLSTLVSQSPDSEFWYTVVALAESWLESVDGAVVRAQIDAGGVLVFPPPNRVLHAVAKPTLAGGARVEFAYSAVKQAGVGTAVQVAEIVAGLADWQNILGTANLWPDGLTIGQIELSKTWPHGENIALAIRAITADVVPAAGPEKVVTPILALATPPAAVIGITVQVYE